MSEEEYIPIEKGTTFGMRGLRAIEREGEPLPEYVLYLHPLVMFTTGTDAFDEGTFNGKHYKWMQRKRDGKLVSITKDGKVFEVI